MGLHFSINCTYFLKIHKVGFFVCKHFRDGKLCLGGLHLSVPHWEVVNYTTVFCFIIGEVDAEAGKLFFVECFTHLG